MGATRVPPSHHQTPGVPTFGCQPCTGTKHSTAPQRLPLATSCREGAGWQQLSTSPTKPPGAVLQPPDPHTAQPGAEPSPAGAVS